MNPNSKNNKKSEAKKNKGLSDAELIKKYENGPIDLKTALKKALKKDKD